MIERETVTIVIPEGYAGRGDKFCEDCGFEMAERPTELDLALDAVDDLLKEEITNITKDLTVNGDEHMVKARYDQIRKARKIVIAMVTSWSQGQ